MVPKVFGFRNCPIIIKMKDIMRLEKSLKSIIIIIHVIIILEIIIIIIIIK
jgi:hypothetical protein